MKEISRFTLSDMTALYRLNEDGTASFFLLPSDEDLKFAEKNIVPENLVQLKIEGDIYNETYAMGVSMRNGESCRRLKYSHQETEDNGAVFKIITHLEDERGYQARHILKWEKGSSFVRMSTEFENNSESPVNIEMLESFSLSSLTPYLEGDAFGSMDIFRIRSVWSGEGRVERRSVEELALEKAWADHAVRCERYGQAGSMPVNHFFPFGALYDKVNKVYWGAQIAHNASWQMEFYRKDEGLSFSGGLADREFGHWVKTVGRGEIFAAPEALVSAAKMDGIDEDADFDRFCQRITSAGLQNIKNGPECEKSLPVIFNEYCTTWGNPSIENIKNTVDKIRDKGLSYFVIDCGWYKQDGIPWDKGMGDYEVSRELFPEGIDKAVKYINNADMKAGIWFEIENVAPAARAYSLTDHLLKRDGKTLTTYARRFWDMRDSWVRDYLREKVIGTLKDNGFEYMKIDYNESIGIGCDGAESLGEGLRQNMAAAADFVREVKKELPEIVLENCASGGHRLEPLMMSLCSMASFSDAHECAEIPVIAAAVQRMIHPAQSQIWAVIRRDDSLKRIAYSLNATMLGRMCLSGDVTDLNEEQWDVIDRGIAFYKEAADIILNGVSVIKGDKQKSFRHPEGWQAVIRESSRGTLAVIHSFGGFEGEIKLELSGQKELKKTYFTGRKEIVIDDDRVKISGLEDFDSIAFICC